MAIKIDDITIQGAGNGTDGSILRPPADLPGRCFKGVAGFCVFGDFDAGTPVDGVTVTGAEGFDPSGFIAIMATHTTFDTDAGMDSNEYGLAAFQSSGTIFQDNIASGNGVAGIYDVGDSPMRTRRSPGTSFQPTRGACSSAIQHTVMSPGTWCTTTASGS